MNCEIREMFNSFQDVNLNGTNNIGTVCNHFGGTDFRTTVRTSKGRPFGLRGDPQDLVAFSRLLIDGHDLKRAREKSRLSRYQTVKLIRVLNAALEKRGRPPVYKLPLCKTIKIICDQTEQVFPSINAAAQIMRLNRGQLSGHINGKRACRTVKGYTFSPVDAELNAIQKEKFNRAKAKKGAYNGNQPIAIICDQTRQVFPSMFLASRAMRLDKRRLSQHINGNGSARTVKGYTFSPIDAKLDKAQKEKLNRAKCIKNKPISIVCNETGNVFQSMYAAAHIMGLDNNNLRKHLKGKASYKSVEGYTFSIIDGDLLSTQQLTLASPVRSVNDRQTLPIICHQTGEIYLSQNAAAKALKINKGGLSCHLNGRIGCRTVQGYTFSRITDEQIIQQRHSA